MLTWLEIATVTQNILTWLEVVTVNKNMLILLEIRTVTKKMLTRLEIATVAKKMLVRLEIRTVTVEQQWMKNSNKKCTDYTSHTPDSWYIPIAGKKLITLLKT